MTKAKPQPAAEVLQLPLWGESKRAFPTSFVKGALFTVGGKSPRRTYTEDVTVASFPNTEIIYKGTELRDDDEDVLMQLFHRARGARVHPEHGLEVDFSGFSLLTELEWPTTKAYYEKLRACLDRLQTGSVKVRISHAAGSTVFRGQMIRKYKMTTDLGYKSQWKVWIEPEVVKLFRPNHLELEWSQRKRLSKPIAKWLHGFMSDQMPEVEVFTAPEEALYKYSGSTASSLRTFRSSLKESLEEMQSTGVIADWKLHDGILFVAREEGVDINRTVAAARIQFNQANPSEGQLGEMTH